MARLTGKVALITGGARGQGRAIAEKFAAEGADIAFCDVDADLDMLDYPRASEDDLASTASALEDRGVRVHAEIADVRSQAALDGFVANAVDKLGKIDIVIANAGVVHYRPFWEITEQEWGDLMDINLAGAWRTAKAVAPYLIERQAGVIVFTSSINGAEGGLNYMHYIASKHGVLGIMRSAALELGRHDIRCHAVLPGAIDTAMNDNKPGRDRIAGVEDATRDQYLDGVLNWHALRGRTALPPETVADGMIWLVSDEARHTTGIELVIDAGHRVLPGINMDPIKDPERMSAPR